MLTTTINTLPLAYQAASGDTPATIAAAHRRRHQRRDNSRPGHGLPLNSVVTASAADGVITLTGTVPDDAVYARRRR